MKLSRTLVSIAALALMTSSALATSTICQEQTIDGGTHQEDVFADVERMNVTGGGIKGGRAYCQQTVAGCIPFSLSEPVTDTFVTYHTETIKVGENTVDNPDIEQYREGELNPIKTIIATIQNHQYTPVYDFDAWADGSCS